MTRLRLSTIIRLIAASFSGLVSSTLLAAESDDFVAADVYQAKCYSCHGTGVSSAPVLGDVIAWEIRLEKGVDTLVQNAISGLNGMMPPRGLCAECSDEDLRKLVEYILEMSK